MANAEGAAQAPRRKKQIDDYYVETHQTSHGTVEAKHWHQLTNRQIVYATVIAMCAWTFSTFDFVLSGTLLPVMATEFGWSTAYSSMVSMFISIGVLLVSFTVGPIAEKIGRSNALMLVTLSTAFASFLTGFTMSVIYLVLVRAISGFGYQEQTINSAYMNEITVNVKNKGFVYGFVQGGWPIGTMLAAAFTTFFLDSFGWRGVYWFATIPAVIIVLLRIRLKESPRFFEVKEIRAAASAGDMEKAKALGEVYQVDVEKMYEKNTLGQLFEKGYARHTICLLIANILIWFPCQVFSVLGTTVLTSAKGLSFDNALLMTIIINCVAYVGYLVAGKVGDKFGRKIVIVTIWIISGCAYAICMLLCHSFASVLLTYLIGTFCMLGGWATLMTYQGESYPTRVRAFAVSFQNAVGYIGAIIASGLFSAVIASSGTMIAALLVGAIPMAVAGVVMLGTHYVKPGQKLEDISQ